MLFIYFNPLTSIVECHFLLLLLFLFFFKFCFFFIYVICTCFCFCSLFEIIVYKRSKSYIICISSVGTMCIAEYFVMNQIKFFFPTVFALFPFSFHRVKFYMLFIFRLCNSKFDRLRTKASFFFFFINFSTQHRQFSMSFSCIKI